MPFSYYSHRNLFSEQKVKSKSNVSGEQDIGIDLEQAHPPQQAEEQDMDLSHEEILVTQERSFNSIPDLSIDTAAEQELTNNSTGSYDNGDIVNDDDDGAGIIICTFVDLNRTTGANKQLNVNVNANSSNENDQIHNDDDGDGASIIYASADLVNRKVGANSISTSGFFTNKNDIMIETLRSIRSSLNTAIIDESSLYCPKSCSMCYDNYAKGDDIAWSKNEQCCHAFHTDCIMQWLMNHDDCPMCRNNYLEGTGAA